MFPIGRMGARLSYLAFALLALLTPCHAQDDPCTPVVDQASDISLELSLKDGQTIFRQGEVIALTATYSSASEKPYSLDTRNYDRSGRLSGTEVSCIVPPTEKDPLTDYFDGGMGGIGGGLSGTWELRREGPFVVNMELNEWKSLSPGSYRLRIAGHRVSLPGENSGNPEARPIPLQSNEVEFQVVEASPEWQAEQLAASVHALDSADPSSEEAKHAAKILRFLGSEASTRELARRYWGSNDQPFGWDFKFGLFGSPYRTQAIESMKAALQDGRHPVTQEFLNTLALLEVQSDPKSQLPPYDEKNAEAWTRVRDAHFEAINKLAAKYTAEAAARIQTKSGQARAVTVTELLQSDTPLSPTAKTQLEEMLVASWDSLPVTRQNELIQYRWEQVGDPQLLPILRHIVDGEGNPDRRSDQPDRATALQRIYELSPGEGRQRILRELTIPKGDIGIGVLGMLPEHELPQLDLPLITKLKAAHASDTDFELLERYASEKALPDIQQVYSTHRGEWACVPQTAMLRYFLRVQPDYGVTQVEDALNQRKSTGCYIYQFVALAEDVSRPRIEKMAIRALNDPSAELAGNAAEALEKYGSSRAEPALWARMEKFHEQWKDHPDRLHFPGSKPNVQAEVRLEQILVSAILNGQAWFTAEDAIRRLKELSSPQMQSELDGVLQESKNGRFDVSLNWWPGGTLDFTVGRYSGKGMAALKDKLAQLPASTQLHLSTTVAERDRHRAEFVEIQSAAAADSLTLLIETPR